VPVPCRSWRATSWGRRSRRSCRSSWRTWRACAWRTTCGRRRSRASAAWRTGARLGRARRASWVCKV